MSRIVQLDNTDCSVCGAKGTAELKCEDALFFRQCSECGSDYAGTETYLNKMIAQDFYKRHPESHPMHRNPLEVEKDELLPAHKEPQHMIDRVKSLMLANDWPPQKAWRRLRGFTQVVDTAAAFGCSPATAKRLENSRNLKQAQIETWSKYLSIAPYYLNPEVYK